MHRVYALAAALLLTLAAGSRIAVTAQEEGASDIPAVGTTVPFIGLEGEEVARLTVREVIDPFEDYDPNTPPERGNHFVMVRLDVENTGSRPFSFDPSGVRLQDADGFLYSYGFVYRAPEETEADPDLQFGEIPAGDTVSGPIFFSVFNDAELVRVLYQPDFDRLVFLADLTLPGAPPAATPAAADATPAASTDANAAAAAANCAGVEEWFEQTNEVMSPASSILGGFSAGDLGDVSAQELEEVASQLEELTETQRSVEVPAAAEEANDLILETLAAFSDAVDQAIAADGDADALDAVAEDVDDATNLFLNEVIPAIQTLGTDCDVDL